LQLIKRHFKQHGNAVLATLLACLVLLVDAMAACPSLHELIHHEAGEPGHECAVTLFAHGQVDSATVDVPIIATTIPCAAIPLVSFSAFAPAIESLPAGRAPPVLPVVS